MNHGAQLVGLVAGRAIDDSNPFKFSVWELVTIPTLVAWQSWHCLHPIFTSTNHPTLSPTSSPPTEIQIISSSPRQPRVHYYVHGRATGEDIDKLTQANRWAFCLTVTMPPDKKRTSPEPNAPEEEGPQTPGSPPQKKLRITQKQKQALIDNLQLERMFCFLPKILSRVAVMDECC